jgi:methionyl-tRNA formyltransferase
MRVVFMGNNRVGLALLRWLVERGRPPVGLVVHPPARSKFRDEMIEAVAPFDVPVWNADRLKTPELLAELRAVKPDLIVSVLFGYILPKPVIDLPRAGAINLHNGYLPYNAGSFANVWSIVERTPAGATLHYMDEGIDTGDIIARREAPVTPDDTGDSIYRKIEDAQIALFQETWDAILDGTAGRTKQDMALRTYHRLADAEKIDKIDLERSYRARELIDILRARTFPPYRGAYFDEAGRRYYISIAIEEAKS